jgi:hypothetical protein
MRVLAKTAGLVAVLTLASPAGAISLTNRDDRDHKITIIEGAEKVDHKLGSQAALEGVCLKGCVIRLNDSDNDEYELEGNEIVSIEEGYLYYDGPDAPAEPPAADSGKPAAPKQ